MNQNSQYKTKTCIICNELKKLEENFRIVNILNGYTSKTCNACESLVINNQLNKIHQATGIIYALFDSSFPKYLKIGYTRNPIQRLRDYNKSRPIDTCSYVYTSKLLIDILKREQKLLSRIYRYTYNATDRPEWFSIKYKEKIIKEIQLIENEIILSSETINLGY